MDRRIRKVVHVLESEWRANLSVGDLALKVGLGMSRLEHLFKAEAKISIRGFILERRLVEAAAMLETTEERISTISYNIGFRDVSNFNHAFKKRFGLCPRQYRARRDGEIVSDSDQGKTKVTN